MQPTQRYTRPSWDDYFMAICKIVATRATCDRLRAGAVLVKENRIVSTGYNGSPPGLAHCDEVGHLMEEGHCVRTIHAEHNVILQAAVIPGGTTCGATIYIKFSPCIHCCKYIVAAGIKRVVIGKIYRNSQAIDYLKAAGLQVDIFAENAAVNQFLAQEVLSKEVEEAVAKEGQVVLKENA